MDSFDFDLRRLPVNTATHAPQSTSGRVARRRAGYSLAWMASFITFAAHAAGGVVISQVYGGGGNAGAPLSNDFIELHNESTAPLVLDGWSVQYASATGNRDRKSTRLNSS